MNKLIGYILFCSVLTISCNQAAYVKRGDYVQIELKLTNKNKRIIDQTGYNQRKLPLLLKVGQHEVFEPIDLALVGMKLRQVKHIKLLAKDTYSNRGVFYLNKEHDTTYVVNANETLFAQIKVLKIN
jgi:hypothetical protein